MGAIPTLPPYAPYISEVMAHRHVTGARLNTVMPLVGTLKEELTRLSKLMNGKPLWIDLKGRQIRTSYGQRIFEAANPAPAGAGVRLFQVGAQVVQLDPAAKLKYKGDVYSPPWAAIPIDKSIELDTSKPVLCLFKGGAEKAYILKVEGGSNLIMMDGPRRPIGGGESINIMHPSLVIHGYLTDRDKEYIQAAGEVGLHDYMLSFVENDSDINDVLALDPKANIVAKIESEKGLEWAKTSQFVSAKKVRLMAARGDLWVQLSFKRADLIVSACEDLVKADPTAIVASRILDSLADTPMPKCNEIMDVQALQAMGYRHFMLGDEVCFRHEALLLGLDMLEAMHDRVK